MEKRAFQVGKRKTVRFKVKMPGLPERVVKYRGKILNSDISGTFRIATGRASFPEACIRYDRLIGNVKRKRQDQRWRMRSSDGVNSYVVKVLNDEWSCECLGFQFRRYCRHIKEKQNENKK